MSERRYQRCRKEGCCPLPNEHDGTCIGLTSGDSERIRDEILRAYVSGWRTSEKYYEKMLNLREKAQ